MGMDVIGVAPTGEAGRHFRNNVWWWHPLWEYCTWILPEPCGSISGHTNDGDGLDREGALLLANVLRDALRTGEVAEFSKRRHGHLADLPRDTCIWCHGTGIRTDDVGVMHEMPIRELESHLAVALGRERGWCNCCNGEGLVDHAALSYHFDTENVSNFVAFLEECGGFEIW